MKTKLRHVFLASIIKESKDDLELSPRERAMVKWFIKFQSLIILIVIVWYTPIQAVRQHLYEYKDIKEQVASFNSIAQAEENEPPTSETKATSTDRSAEEEYYYLLETNEEFKHYITRMSVTNNNPGNLVYSNQPNATKCGRFACFPNATIGFRALIKQIELDQSRDHTIESFLNKYAPSFENNTESYIQGAEDFFSVDRYTKLNTLNTIKLAQYISFREHSVAIVNY